MRSLLTLVLSVARLNAGAGVADAQTPTASERPCFDLAVIATSPTYRWLPVKAAPDEIIIRSPVQLTFDVEETLAGAIEPETVIVDTGLHTRFNPDIEYFLLFLKRQPSGHYRSVASFHEVVRQYDGEFVWPLAAPLPASYLDDERLVPSTYQTLLRPIRYRPEDAWWLAPSHRYDWSKPIQAADYPWGVAGKDDVVVAARGLRIRDLVNAAAGSRCGMR